MSDLGPLHWGLEFLELTDGLVIAGDDLPAADLEPVQLAQLMKVDG